MKTEKIDNQKIEKLILFFKTSTAMFEFMQKILDIHAPNSSNVNRNDKMYSLHKLAIVELEKDKVDLIVLDNLLAEMEKLAEQNSIPIPNFEVGGTTSSVS